jgi:gas vesicle protein
MTDNENYRNGDCASDSVRLMVAGFGMGLLVGAAIGLLLAPKSGRETRDELRGFATEFGTKARSTAADLGEKAKVAYTNIGEQARPPRRLEK